MSMSTSETEVSGIFFRLPIFGRYFDLWEDNEKFSAQSAKAKKGFWGVMHWLLNSNKSIDSKIEFSSKDNAAGYRLWSVRSPIYFKRIQRELSYVGDNGFCIESKGFNYTDERVGGGCVKEVTTIKLPGRTVFKGRSDKNGGYHFTYEHVVMDRVKEYKATGTFTL